jgi:hypothetical protein
MSKLNYVALFESNNCLSVYQERLVKTKRNISHYIVTCWGLPVTYKTGSGLDA